MVLLPALCFAITSCVSQDTATALIRRPTDTASNTLEPVITPAQTKTAATPTLEYRIEEMLSSMTIEEKVGQLFIVYFDGSTYSEALERTIRELHIGGIIIFSPNISSLEDTVALINMAQLTATNSGAEVPLIVAIDHEGGAINRFGNEVTQFPSNMALAATGSVENAKDVARATAEELKALGINMNLAPVMDVNSNPDNPVIGIRSFSSNPAVVAQFGTVMIREFQANNMMATAKHFPGHGDTSVDSHIALPIVAHDRKHLDSVEFIPFKAAISVDIDAIMTAHVFFPAIDTISDTPATLSEAVLTDLLRGELGFNGLIATDSLGMGAISQGYGIADAAAQAFRAGADLLMFGNDPGQTPAEQYPAYQNLLALVRNGTISQERLDASVRRILLVKAKRDILDWQPSSPSEIGSKVLTPQHLALAETIAEQSVTLLRNDRRLLPIEADRRVLLVYPNFVAGFESALSEYGNGIVALPIGIDPNEQELSQVFEAAKEYEVIVVATANARDHPSQVRLIESLQQSPLVVIALQSPYDLLAFPDTSTYLAIYGDTPAAIHAVAKVLFGQIHPSGKLPIALSDLFPEQYGLDNFQN
jgi:beta-N-acetylhexosaminidase